MLLIQRIELPYDYATSQEAIIGSGAARHTQSYEQLLGLSSTLVQGCAAGTGRGTAVLGVVENADRPVGDPSQCTGAEN